MFAFITVSIAPIINFICVLFECLLFSFCCSVFFERWGKEWDEKNQQFAIFQIPHIFGNLKNYRETFIYFHICNSGVYMCMANALIFAISYTGSTKTVTTMLSNRTAYCGPFPFASSRSLHMCCVFLSLCACVKLNRHHNQPHEFFCIPHDRTVQLELCYR